MKPTKTFEQIVHECRARQAAAELGEKRRYEGTAKTPGRESTKQPVRRTRGRKALGE